MVRVNLEFYNEKTVTDLTNKINSASTLKELISKKSIQEAKNTL